MISGTSERRQQRCAIYTRKSTEEGLDQDFNSLDAQRESGEAYVSSQKHEGWVALPDRYDDGGFTGANLERPAVQRLMADIEAGKVDVVVVYKVDRLSRSLLDFARIMETFEKHKVSFVSVTQQFNTASSIGRLVLNILLSFAQFEREMIGERTRDKMAAAKRKGKWIGGRPPLGYDVVKGRLVINDAEAELVREIFRQYLQERSLLRAVELLNGRGSRMKSWTTRSGRVIEGGPWDKGSVRRLLTSALYVGKIEYQRQLYVGEHDAIVDQDTFDSVAALLREHGPRGPTSNPNAFLLRGLVHCAACQSVMTSTTARPRNTLYRYYQCTAVTRRGRAQCPVRSVPADELERFVVDEIAAIGRDAVLVREVTATIATDSAALLPALQAERSRLTREGDQLQGEAKSLFDSFAGLESTLARERLAAIERRLAEVRQRQQTVDEQLAALASTTISEAEVTHALGLFAPVWDVLATQERSRVLQLLVERVDYDGVAGEVALTFSPLGLRLLAREATTAPAARMCS